MNVIALFFFVYKTDPDSGMVTEAMKLKRQSVEKKYIKELEQLYKSVGGGYKE